MREKSETEEKRLKEQFQARERQLKAEVEEGKAELERLRRFLEDFKVRSEGTVKEMEAQLASTMGRSAELTQEVESARAGQLAANNHCQELQALLQEVQERSQLQVGMCSLKALVSYKCQR